MSATACNTSFSSNELDVTNTAGPQFLVIILNWGLFGVLSIQTYIYAQAFPNDELWLKVLVWVVYLLEMTQTFLLTETAWSMLVRGFGNLEALDEIGTLWISVGIIAGLIGLFVHLFYAHRIAILSQKRILPAGIIIVSIITFVGTVMTAITGKEAKKFSILLVDKERTAIMLLIWGVVSSGCDVTIATFMCYHLHKWRDGRLENARFNPSEALISKFIRITAETGILTAVTSFSTIVVYFPPALKGSTYYFVPTTVYAKLYSTTMLAMLNSRLKLGATSTASTWRDHELEFAAPQSTRDAHQIGLSITSRDGAFQNRNVFVKKDETIAADSPKIGHFSPVD